MTPQYQNTRQVVGEGNVFTIDHLFQLILVIIGTLAIPWAYRVTTRLTRIETILDMMIKPFIKKPNVKLTAKKRST